MLVQNFISEKIKPCTFNNIIPYLVSPLQRCNEGYYRGGPGPYLGTCIPCNCNGHADRCDPITGQCIVSTIVVFSLFFFMWLIQAALSPDCLSYWQRFSCKSNHVTRSIPDWVAVINYNSNCLILHVMHSSKFVCFLGTVKILHFMRWCTADIGSVTPWTWAWFCLLNQGDHTPKYNTLLCTIITRASHKHVSAFSRVCTNTYLTDAISAS